MWLLAVFCCCCEAIKLILWKWLLSVLSYLGLYNKFRRLVFLGPDNAGKTTIIHLLSHNQLGVYEPTMHPERHEFVVDGASYEVYDIYERCRGPILQAWKDYLPAMDAIVLVVDAAVESRFSEAKLQLDDILLTMKKWKVSLELPILVLANKIDDPRACSEEEMRKALDIPRTAKEPDLMGVVGEGRPVELFMCSAYRQRGFVESFRWLNQHF